MSARDFSDPVPDPQEAEIAERLEGDRPLPAPEFREGLARQLTAEDPGWGPRPEHLWPRALALISVGAVLLLAGALISTGGI